MSAARRHRRSGGFTLVELLLACALGMGLCAAMLQLLLLHGHQGERLVRLLRERGFQRRTLELLRGDLQRADRVLLAESHGAPCPLGGRQTLLQIDAGEPLKLQLQDFIDAIRTGRKPFVDAEAGFAAVRTAERIVAAARALNAPST